MKSRIAAALVIVVVIGGLFAAMKARAPKPSLPTTQQIWQQEGIPVDTARVVIGDIDQTVEVTGNINALTFAPTVTDGGGSHNYGFLVGAGNTVVGANEHVFSGSQRWMTFAVIGSRLFWSYDLLNPDDTVSPSDSYATSGSAAITVPTGTFNFSILAAGAGSGSGSNQLVDFVEIVSGNREA